MDLLGRLFGSEERVKLLRLFILNPDTVFPLEELVKRTRLKARLIKQELEVFKRIGFAAVKVVTLTPPKPSHPSSRRHKKKAVRIAKSKGWQLLHNFPYLDALTALLRNDLVARRKELVARFARAGQVKLLVVAGIFLNEAESRADLLVVGDKLKKRVIERLVEAVESEAGRGLSYAVMDTPEFVYRYHACDKFVRDILDYAHERLIDRLHLE